MNRQMPIFLFLFLPYRKLPFCRYSFAFCFSHLLWPGNILYKFRELRLILLYSWVVPIVSTKHSLFNQSFVQRHLGGVQNGNVVNPLFTCSFVSLEVYVQDEFLAVGCWVRRKMCMQPCWILPDSLPWWVNQPWMGCLFPCSLANRAWCHTFLVCANLICERWYFSAVVICISLICEAFICLRAI